MLSTVKFVVGKVTKVAARKLFLSLATTTGLAGMIVAAPVASAHPRGEVEIRIGDREGCRQWVPPVVEERRVNVFVEPVYRRVSDEVYVKPVYRTVCDRRWIEPAYRTECVRVLVPAVYETREVTRLDSCGRRFCTAERVMVCPAHYEKRETQVLACGGHWETYERQECVSEGRYQHVERQELVTPGHYETRCQRAEVVPAHYETMASSRVEFRFRN